MVGLALIVLHPKHDNGWAGKNSSFLTQGDTNAGTSRVRNNKVSTIVIYAMVILQGRERVLPISSGWMCGKQGHNFRHLGKECLLKQENCFNIILSTKLTCGPFILLGNM